MLCARCVWPGADDARLLRVLPRGCPSPRVVALDDSFVTSAERAHSKGYFEGADAGRSMRALLLTIRLRRGGGDGRCGRGRRDRPFTAPMVTLADLKARGRLFERSEALLGVFDGWEGVAQMNNEERLPIGPPPAVARVSTSTRSSATPARRSPSRQRPRRRRPSPPSLP